MGNGGGELPNWDLLVVWVVIFLSLVRNDPNSQFLCTYELFFSINI